MPLPAQLLALAFAFSLPADPNAADDPPADDLATLKGAWTAKVGPSQDVALEITFDGKSATLVFDAEGQDPVTLKGEVALDAKADPKTIDWTGMKRADGTDAPPNRSIYRIEGDTLTICTGGPDADRPTAFEPGFEGRPPFLLELKRKP